MADSTPNYLDVGFDKNLYRGTPLIDSLSSVLTNPVSTAGSLSLDPSTISDPISGATPSTSVLSGNLDQILFSGKTSFTDTSAGFRMGLDGNNGYRFVIGNASSFMDWNVTAKGTLTVSGTITVIAGSIAGLTISANALTATAGGNTTIVSSGSTAFTAGPTGSPTFTVTQAGELTATSVTVTGTVNATGGYVGASSALVVEASGYNFGTTGAIRGGATAYNTGTGWWLGYDTAAYKFFIGTASGNKLTWDGSTLDITGTVTASAGTIGGWTVGATTITSTGVTIASGSTAYLAFGSTPPTGPSTGTGIYIDKTGLYGLLSNSQVTKIDSTTGGISGSSFTITGGTISNTSLSGIPNNTSTDISLLSFTYNMAFTSSSATKISWGSGTIVMSNGRTFSISSGDTGTMAALTYIYLDTGVSSTALQTTTTYSTAMGANKLIVGTAQNNTVTASFIPFNGSQPLIDGANIGALSIVAGNIAASTITAAKMNVSQLSAITADLGSITAGSISVVNGGDTVFFTPNGTYAIGSGPTGSPTFTVTPAGVMNCTGATVNGSPIANEDVYGDGSDGTVTFDGSTSVTGFSLSGGVYTQTRDVYFADMTVNSGVTVKTASYNVYANGSVSISGTIGPIGADGTAGGNGSNGVAGGGAASGGTAGDSTASAGAMGVSAIGNGSAINGNAASSGSSASSTANTINSTSGSQGGQGGTSGGGTSSIFTVTGKTSGSPGSAGSSSSSASSVHLFIQAYNLTANGSCKSSGGTGGSSGGA
ncbi:MAG: hypothetical protein KGL39_47205, partial [Patescibacteria group bacterium]|nr:hypothetical protein [Patescibacteria group bacterium]